ncbi:MAG: tRNA pseudouridine(38-40) synthase TruA [Candidatus Riflebacteria bacterium]|nr:tRNA pseudouridine(38-40) synthase TruA [Candidatus Riflebacteria bacterium]
MTLSPRNLKMIVTYDGSAFNGFQIQPDVPTVQAELERTAGLIFGTASRVVGSGRTDTGVHALGQVAMVKTVCPIPVDKLRLAMNARLPESIRVRSIEEVSSEFHARFSAKSKQYRYLIRPVKEVSPFLVRFCHQIVEPLDIEKMREGAARFVGVHDFSAFTRSPVRVEEPRRHILKSEIEVLEGTIVFDVIGTGFLYNMVRNMTKALLLIGLGKMEPNEIEELYRNQDRTRLGAPAPPGGLYLMKVMY